MNLKGKKKGVVLLVLLLVLLVCGGVYTAYRLHPESFVGKNDVITRGEFAADLAKELKLDTGSAVKDTPTFSDIDGHWAEKYIEALVSAGIIDPADYPDGFKPDEPITRAEIIKMLVRAKGQDNEAKNTKGHSGYDDQSDIPDDGKGYVIVGKEDGIIGGTDDGKLHPNDPVTKGEADDMTGKADPKPATPTPSSPAADTQTPSNPEQPTPPPSEPEKPTPTPTPTPGGSDSGGSYYYPDAQVRFELPETAYTDAGIEVMPVWKYTQSFEWSLTKTAADGSKQPVELTDAVTGSLGLEGGTIQFKNDGVYTLTATAKNVRGKETTLSKTVAVYPILDLTFDLPETTHTDKSVTLAYAPASLYGHDIVWTAKKDSEAASLTDILDGTLGSEGGTFAFKSKGSYTLTTAVTDETGRVFTHTESTKVYPVAGIVFTLPETSHTDTSVNVAATLTNADGLPVTWSLTKNGEPAALSDELDGALTDAGGKIRFKDKGVYRLIGTLTDETGRTFEDSRTVTVYPVGSVGFYLPEIAHTDTDVQVKATFKTSGPPKFSGR